MLIKFIVACLMVDIAFAVMQSQPSYRSPSKALKPDTETSSVHKINYVQQYGSKGNDQPVSQQASPSPIHAAIQSKRYVEVVPVISANRYASLQPQVIEVDSITAPVQFLFRSASGPLLVQQVHVASAPQEAQHVRSEEPVHHLTHEVYKPVVQELREVIQPFRRVTQEIKPVVEEVRTVVASASEKIDSQKQAVHFPSKVRLIQQPQQQVEQQQQQEEVPQQQQQQEVQEVDQKDEAREFA